MDDVDHALVTPSKILNYTKLTEVIESVLIYTPLAMLPH